MRPPCITSLACVSSRHRRRSPDTMDWNVLQTHEIYISGECREAFRSAFFQGENVVRCLLNAFTTDSFYYQHSGAGCIEMIYDPQNCTKTKSGNKKTGYGNSQQLDLLMRWLVTWIPLKYQGSTFSTLTHQQTWCMGSRDQFTDHWKDVRDKVRDNTYIFTSHQSHQRQRIRNHTWQQTTWQCRFIQGSRNGNEGEVPAHRDFTRITADVFRAIQ